MTNPQELQDYLNERGLRADGWTIKQCRNCTLVSFTMFTWQNVSALLERARFNVNLTVWTGPKVNHYKIEARFDIH